MGSGASSASANSVIHERLDNTPRDSPSSEHGTRRRENARRQELTVPAPCPPRTRKTEMFQETDYKHVDDYVSQMPQKLNYGSFEDLVTYLTFPDDWDDIAKVRAIYRWVTSVDVFSAQVDSKPPKFSPMDYFLKIQNNEGNHAYLMAGVCRLAGIPCAMVDGINKSAAYEVGKKLNKQSMRAQWNAVYVGGNWRFIDAFWASACVVGRKTGEWSVANSEGETRDEEDDANEGETQHRINEFYFFPDPDVFIWTHFPRNPMWQLLEKPLSLTEFENHFYVRERFHILGMSVVPATKTSCVVETEDGETELCFGLPRGRSSNFRFRYVLYRSRAAAKESKLDMFFDRFVIYEKLDYLLKFVLRFPVTGSFKLDIYGMDNEDGDAFDLCCTYIINCSEAKKNCLPLPDCPKIGWGPQAETQAAGLTPVTHKEAEIFSNDKYVEILLNSERDIALYHVLKHSLLDEATLSKYSVAELKAGKAVVYLRLPQKGEYALKLYAQELNEQGPTQNILNYLVNCSSMNSESQPFPNVSCGLLGRNPIISSIYGVEPVSHTEAHLEAEDGKVSLQFKADKNVELICEIHTNDRKGAGLMKSVTTNSGKHWTFDLDIPVKGEYSCNVFAREKGQPDQIHSVQSYLIDSEGHDGVADDVDEVDTWIPTETFDTSDEEVTIPVPSNCKIPAAEINRRNGYDPPESDMIQFITEDDVHMVKVRLTNYGKYMLTFYDLNEAGNEVHTVTKYQINRKRPGKVYSNNISSIMNDIKITSRQPSNIDKEVNSEEQSRDRARRNIQNALDLNDVHLLEEAIKKFIALGGDVNDPLLKRAQRQVEALKSKLELMEASQKRDLQLLVRAIAHAKKVNVNHEVDVQIILAEKLRDHLVKMEKLRHAVLDMEAKTIAEIKSYSNPPDGVHQCLTATFLLLGHQLKEVKVWQKVQALLGKTGKESVMRKISNFDARKVPLQRAETAKKIIQPYNRDQIRDLSAGAATFYIWAVEMIEEVRSYGGSERTNHLRLIK